MTTNISAPKKRTRKAKSKNRVIDFSEMPDGIYGSFSFDRNKEGVKTIILREKMGTRN